MRAIWAFAPSFAVVTLCSLSSGASPQYTVTGYYVQRGIPQTMNAKGQIPTAWGGVATLVEGGVVREIGTLPGDTSSDAWAINDNGQVVGRSYASGSRTHAFIWQDGQISALSGLSDASNINGSGQVAGSTNAYLACIWESGEITLLDAPPGCSSLIASAINNAGQVAGWMYRGADSEMFIWQNGQTVSKGSPEGFNRVNPSEMNDAGHVVGYCSVSGGELTQRACLWDGSWSIIPTLRYYHNCNVANDISPTGEIVGTSYQIVQTAPSNYNILDTRPFLCQSGTLYDLNDLIPPGSPCGLREALAIDRYGRILCSGSGAMGNTLILTPVPEPTSCLALFAGLVCTAVRRRGKRTRCHGERSSLRPQRA
jgi:probable HAF family extracellular repeat protein